MTAKHTYKPGDQVVILNSSLSGRLFVEGKATVKRCLPSDEFYTVKFLSDAKRDPSASYDRKVDPAAQADPEAYVAGRLIGAC